MIDRNSYYEINGIVWRGDNLIDAQDGSDELEDGTMVITDPAIIAKIEAETEDGDKVIRLCDLI